MLHYRRWLLLVFVAIQGCAAHAPDPCRSNDWYATGYQEGLAGRSTAAGDTIADACPRGVTDTELAEYRSGRQRGLADYCRPQNGFTLGAQGHSYQGGCGDLEAQFLHAYRRGQQVYQVETQIRRLDAILDVNESERKKLGERIRRKQNQREQGGGGALLQGELRELEETLSVVESEIDALRAALREQQARLALLRESTDLL